MALARLKRKIEKTEGAGNCAFHAFALALCNASVFRQIELSVRAADAEPNERFAGFIKRVAGKLRVNADWKSVTAALIELREKNSYQLQYTLAPILRELSINLARDPIDSVFHTQQTIPSFMGAFDAYCTDTPGDDIYLKHEFIKDKFYEVRHATQDELTREKLLNQWWWGEGYEKFLDAMSCDGVWAGDMELARLARYFSVVVDGIKIENNIESPVPVYGNYGYFPYLHGAVRSKIDKNQIADIMKCLYDRDVLNREDSNDKGVAFNVASFRILQERLGNIFHYDLVSAYISQQENFKLMTVPAEWMRNRLLLAQLLQRNVIARARDGVNYIFATDKDEALLRIGEVPCHDAVMQICEANYEQHALLVLYNERAYHWSNTVSIVESPTEILRRNGLFDPVVVLDLASPRPQNGLRSSNESVRRFT